MTKGTSRKFVAALQMSLDGFIEGAEGEKDWADSWARALGIIGNVDLFVLGAGMYPGYGEYWQAIHDAPEAIPPFQDTPPTPADVAYARIAQTTRHVVVSTMLAEVSWPQAEIVRTMDELRAIKAEAGGTAYVVGGASLVSSLINAGLIDELIVIVHPLVLGSGKALFGDVHERKVLRQTGVDATPDGRAVLRYAVIAA